MLHDPYLAGIRIAGAPPRRFPFPPGPDGMDAHRPVMLDEALAGLAVRRGGAYVDATYGRGGHAAALLDAGVGRLIALDRDPSAADDAATRFGPRADFRLYSTCFTSLAEVCVAEGLSGAVDGVLFDLGVSSPQLDDPARGFSFRADGPLDMRMDPREGEPASAWLAQADEAEIADVLWRCGEERGSRRIARAIVAARADAPIQTTAQLAELVVRCHRGPRQRIHPATRTFQAIRIHVNRELEQLESALRQAVDVLAPRGRLAVISFHSIEDRIVKRFLRGPREDAEAAARGLPVDPRAGQADPHPIRVVGRHFPSDDEAASNPRARSAVLRVAERLTEVKS